MSTTPTPALSALPTSLRDLADITQSQWAAILSGEPPAAARWIESAARLGHADAQAVLGQWLLDGHGLARDPVAAFGWFQQAASQGHAMGINMAGRCAELGWGTAIDLPAAAARYLQAARLGLDAGMYNIANLLAAGQGVAQNHAEALDWYNQAANLGYAKAMTKAGRYHEDGLVVPKDLAKAFLCYQQGAEGGDFRGQFAYAGMLAAQGKSAEALEWLRKVPLTATPAYREQAGRLLLASTDEAFRQVGKEMLALSPRGAVTPA